MTALNHRSRPEKTAMIVAKRIVADIQRSGYTTGDRLPPEKAMLDTYQIGRGTLREALRFLELQGVISLKPGPGGGPTVEKPDASHLATSLVLVLQFDNAPFSTIVEARTDLEPVMARLAASRLTDEQLATLTTSVDLMGDNLNDRDVFLATNREFHEVIGWASGNAMYGFTISALIDIVDGTQLGVDYPEVRRRAIYAAHARILDALSRHDADDSFESMTIHMSEYCQYLQKKYQDVLDQPLTWELL